MAKKTNVGWAMAASLLIGACGGDGSVEFLSLGTAGTGGIYYPLGGAIASRLSMLGMCAPRSMELS